MAESFSKIRSLNFTKQNKFFVTMNPTGDKFPKLNSININDSTFNTLLKGITLPDLSDTPMEEYIAEQWSITRGRLESYIISLNFIDIDAMKLHRYFSKAFVDMERVYPKDQRVQFDIYTAKNNTPDIKLGSFKDCTLIGVSGIQLEQSGNDTLVEFSVMFKTGKLEIDL